MHLKEGKHTHTVLHNSINTFLKTKTKKIIFMAINLLRHVMRIREGVKKLDCLGEMSPKL